MAYPSQSTIRSYGGACPPSYLAGTLAASYSAGQTFTLASCAGWYEVSATGQATSNPLGTSGPFVVTLDFSTATEEKVLCSAVNVSTGLVTVWTDGSNNGRGYDGTTILAHAIGSTLNCFPVASAVENLQLNAGVVSALSSLSSKVDSVTAGDSSITIAGTATAPTVSVALSGVTAGAYGSSLATPTITVDAKGRVTAATTNIALAPQTTLTTTTSLIATSMRHYPCDTTSGAFTVTLPLSPANAGQWLFTLKAGTNALTIAAQTGNTINGLASIKLTAAGQSVLLQYISSTSIFTVISAGSTPNNGNGFAVGGDLIGFMPNPTLAAVGTSGTTGSASSVSVITTDSKGRVTTATDTSIQITESQVTNLTTDLGNKVGTSTTISTTAPLAGGGDLSTNRTLSIADATTTVKGAVQLTDSTSSTSTTTSATPNSVKTAYDLANAATPKTRLINTTAPLAGGGDLTADRTISIADSTTTVKGAVQLTDSTSSTSTTTAATPNSVKTAYDLANGKGIVNTAQTYYSTTASSLISASAVGLGSTFTLSGFTTYLVTFTNVAVGTAGGSANAAINYSMAVQTGLATIVSGGGVQTVGQSITTASTRGTYSYNTVLVLSNTGATVLAMAGQMGGSSNSLSVNYHQLSIVGIS